MDAAAAVIPARWGSTRFPGKPLALLAGKPMIVHVCERVRRCRRVSRLLVATDDERIAAAARAIGVDAVMTRADHPNGTSRIAEAAARLTEPLVVNVQGDEPAVEPELVDAAVAALQTAPPEVPMSTLASPFAPGEDPANPNLVKVVRRVDGTALYFSRSLIPHARDAGTPEAAPLKHVGIYVYRREFLPRFVALPATPLERTEQLEQLRVLEHGFRIAVAIGTARYHGVDTPEQLAALEAKLSRGG